MKEDFLHYVWKYQKFNHQNLFTTGGEPLSIINQGFYAQSSGPDFFNAKILIGNQLWAGNVEIHLKSSDWYLHQHEKDSKYRNVILHVVWVYDYDIFLENNAAIPVLELQGRVNEQLIRSYQTLLQNRTWIYCEKLINNVPEELVVTFREKLFIARAERKSKAISELHAALEFDWEATLFVALAKAFGLNSNAQAFENMAKIIGFKPVVKESASIKALEALFLGTCNLLHENFQESYPKELQEEFGFLKTKYNIIDTVAVPVEFFKLRPENFPTVRLVQLAAVYNDSPYKFQKLLEVKTVADIRTIFHSSVSEYWKNHYVLDKATKASSKSLSSSFIDLLTLNTIIPLLFAYDHATENSRSEFLIDLALEIKPETNTIIKRFKEIGVPSETAFDSQALLELKQQYCDLGNCLKCAIGTHLLNKSEKTL